MIISYLGLTCAILSTAFGQFLYKKFINTALKKFYFGSILLLLLAPIFSFFALKNIPIDIVYIFTALTVLIVMILSKVFLNEKNSFSTYLGVLLILIGVVLYAL